MQKGNEKGKQAKEQAKKQKTNQASRSNEFLSFALNYRLSLSAWIELALNVTHRFECLVAPHHVNL